MRLPEGIGLMRVWWYAAQDPIRGWFAEQGMELVGASRQEPSAEVQVIIADQLTPEELLVLGQRWGDRQPAPWLFSTGVSVPGVIPLAGLPFSDAWAHAIRAVVRSPAGDDRLRSTQLELLTLRRQLAAVESQLRDHQEELVRLETQASMSQLVRVLAHELNNPLAVILGNAELIERGNPDPQKQQQRAQAIVQEVGSCQVIIERLRKFARPQGEPATALSLPQVLAQSLERLRRRGSPLPDVHIDGVIPLLWCGRLALVRAVEQALDNALRAGAQRVTVRCESDDHSGLCRLLLSNDGSTPSERDIREAFHPFFSAGDRAGLGLTLAQSLLSEYRGTVQLAVGPGGQGASTVFTLPQWDQSSQRRAVDAASSDEMVYPQRHHGPRVLLAVVADPMLGEVILGGAEEEGWSIRLETNFQSCVPRSDVGAFLVDLASLGSNGIDALREHLALYPELASSLIVLCTDAQQRALLQLCKDWGCLLLAKPFRAVDLRQLLHQLGGEGPEGSPTKPS